MLHFFQNKNRIRAIAYENGFKDGQKNSNHSWGIKFSRMKKNFESTIDEKDSKIYSMNERIKGIEKTMESFTHLFSRARYLAIKIDEESEGKLQQATEEYKNLQVLANELQGMNRSFEKRLPQFEKQLNEYKKESLQ